MIAQFKMAKIDVLSGYLSYGFHKLDWVAFVLFLLAIVLSVHLRYTASDYTFGVFKLFLRQTLSFISTYS